MKELLYKFVTENTKWSYNSYLNESTDKKESLLNTYIENFIKENRPKPQKFYLRLKESKKILQYKTSPNYGDCCNEEEYILTEEGDKDWYLPELDRVVYVKYHATEWYNSSHKSPNHSYKAEELEVVDEYNEVYENKPISDYDYFIMRDIVYNTNSGKHIIEESEDLINSYNQGYESCKDMKERYDEIIKKVNF